MTLHILRGLPGIGKTHYAESLLHDNVRLITVHDKTCLAETFDAIVNAVDRDLDVIVDGTHILAWEIAQYVSIGIRLRVPIVVTKLIPKHWTPDVAVSLSARSSTRATVDAIWKMQQSWEAVPVRLLKYTMTRTITIEV